MGIGPTTPRALHQQVSQNIHSYFYYSFKLHTYFNNLKTCTHRKLNILREPVDEAKFESNSWRYIHRDVVDGLDITHAGNREHREIVLIPSLAPVDV